MNWLRHAFAVDKPGPAEPTLEQQTVVETVCAEIVRRHLATPALVFLEMSRPLNNLGAQTLHFLTPFLSVLTTADAPTHLAEFLEQRGAIDYICGRIEQLSHSATTTPPEPEDDHSLRKTCPDGVAGVGAESSERSPQHNADWGLPAVAPSGPQEDFQQKDGSSKAARSDSTGEAGTHRDD